MIGPFSDLGRGFISAELWNSITTPQREEAEATICARLRAGWRPPTAVFDDLAADLEILARTDWGL